jgi:hypothetical protein
MPERKFVMPHSIPPPTFRLPETNSRIRVHGNTKYNERKAKIICERLMLGETLVAICDDPRLPNRRTIIRWLADPRRVDFREMYYFSRRVAVESLVDEIVTIADDNSGDWQYTYDKDGEINGIKADNEAIQRSRVRIDTRKWLAAKLVPRIYGDNTQVELGVTGDLAELLKRATNQDSGLPPAIEGELDG